MSVSTCPSYVRGTLMNFGAVIKYFDFLVCAVARFLVRSTRSITHSLCCRPGPSPKLYVCLCILCRCAHPCVKNQSKTNVCDSNECCRPWRSKLDVALKNIFFLCNEGWYGDHGTSAIIQNSRFVESPSSHSAIRDARPS
jgi:hypothetical protein